MIELVAVFLAAWLVIVAAGGTPIGRMLRATLVERPAACLAAIGRGHLALVALIAIVIGTVAWIGEGDGVRMLAMAVPEAATWLTTFEIAAYLDVAIAAVAAWSAVRLRLPFVLPRRAGHTRHVHPTAVRRPPANDDEEPRRRRAA